MIFFSIHLSANECKFSPIEKEKVIMSDKEILTHEDMILVYITKSVFKVNFSTTVSLKHNLLISVKL